MTGEIWKRIRTGLFKRKRTGVSRVFQFFGGRTSAFEWHPQNSSFTFQFHLYPCILSQCWWVWGHLKKGLKVEWEVPLHSLKGKINGMAYCIIIIIFSAKHNYICTWREGRKFTTLKALHPASILTLHFRTLEIGRKTKILDKLRPIPFKKLYMLYRKKAGRKYINKFILAISLDGKIRGYFHFTLSTYVYFQHWMSFKIRKDKNNFFSRNYSYPVPVFYATKSFNCFDQKENKSIVSVSNFFV